MRLVVLLVVLSCLSGTAVAQTLFANEVLDFSDEPDDATDANGIEAAKEGVAPARILNAKWVNTAIPIFFVSLTQAQADSAGLVGSLAGPDVLLPGATGKFYAWYGDWADYDGDQHLNSGESLRLGASLGTRDCRDRTFTSVNGGDPVGVVTLPQPVTTPEAVVADCRGDVEWTGLSGASVASYITPTRPELLVGAFITHTQRDGTPDLVYGETSFFADGPRYWSADDGGTYFFFDGSVVQTITMETYVNALPTHEGERSISRNPVEPHDVDTYEAVNPALEALFVSTIDQPLRDSGCDKDDGIFGNTNDLFIFQDGECLATTPVDPILEDIGDPVSPIVDPVLDPLFEALAPVTDPILGVLDGQEVPLFSLVGPQVAIVLPPRAAEDFGYDYVSSPHTYFDVRLAQGAYQPLIVLWNDFEAIPSGTMSMGADGRESAPVVAGVYGFLGLWHDKNADGWIGAPSSPAECPDDPHWCGATPDPNVYSDTTEFSPFCRQTTAVTGEVLATLTSSTGAWGSAGVYVIKDDEGLGVPLASSDAAYNKENAARGFNPWDDVVLDAADGSVDQLVVAGPIDLRLNCDDPTRGYRSFEHVLFPEGGNRGYDVTLATESFASTVFVGGQEIVETISDTDVIRSI